MMAAQRNPVQSIDKVRTVLAFAREREQLADTPVRARNVLVGQCTGRCGFLFAALPVVAVEPLLEVAPLGGIVLFEYDLLHGLPIR
jgi:hypothetical protein